MMQVEAGAKVSAVGEVLKRHRGEMLGFARRRAGHVLDPEDVLQQASLRALAKEDQLRDPARARAWVYRILRNVIADELRAAGLPVQELAEQELAAEVIEEPGRACSCALSVAKTLKPEYSTLLERVVQDEAPITAIAAELGITPNNAMVRLHRARRALKERLLEHCQTESLRACFDCGCEERGCCAT